MDTLIHSSALTCARCQLLVGVDRVADESSVNLYLGLTSGESRACICTRNGIRTGIRHSDTVRGIRSRSGGLTPPTPSLPASALAAAISIAMSHGLGPAGLKSWRAPSSLNRACPGCEVARQPGAPSTHPQPQCNTYVVACTQVHRPACAPDTDTLNPRGPRTSPSPDTVEPNRRRGL